MSNDEKLFVYGVLAIAAAIGVVVIGFLFHIGWRLLDMVWR